MLAELRALVSANARPIILFWHFLYWYFLNTSLLPDAFGGVVLLPGVGANDGLKSKWETTSQTQTNDSEDKKIYVMSTIILID